MCVFSEQVNHILFYLFVQVASDYFDFPDNKASLYFRLTLLVLCQYYPKPFSRDNYGILTSPPDTLGQEQDDKTFPNNIHIVLYAF